MTLERQARPSLQYPLPPTGVPAEWQELLDRIDRLELERARPQAGRP
jgi:hypothetical protein